MAFLLTTISGLSTMLGSLLIFIKVKNKENFINGALSFSAGIMITISLFDLIPESYSLFKYKPFISILILLISINIGIVLSVIIDKYVNHTNNLYRVGIISMLAIILHNIPEGIATYISTLKNTKLGICLSLAIALHNIPEGISISLPIYYATKSKAKALLYTFISGISELFGAVISSLFLKDIMNDTYMGILFGIISGIMLYISIYELLPEAKLYKNKLITLFFIIIGFFIMLISHFLLNI